MAEKSLKKKLWQDRLDRLTGLEHFSRSLSEQWAELIRIRHPAPVNSYVPSGYQTLFEAVEDAGSVLCPSEWDGSERLISQPALDSAAEIFMGPNDDPHGWRALELPIKIKQARSDEELEAALIELLQGGIKLAEFQRERDLEAAENIAKIPPSLNALSRPSRKELSLEERLKALNQRHDTVVTWCKAKLDSLPNEDEAKVANEKIQSRRSSVETAVRDALFSSNVIAFGMGKDGQPTEIPSSVWGTDTGLAAIIGQPGVLIDASGTNIGVILKVGELSRSVSGELPDPHSETKVALEKAIAEKAALASEIEQLKRQIQELQSDTASTPRATSQTQEINTRNKIIAAWALYHKYDPTAGKNEATSIILRLLEDNGYKPDRATLLQCIRDGLEGLDGH